MKTDPNQTNSGISLRFFFYWFFYHTLIYIHFHLTFLEIHNVSQQTRILKKIKKNQTNVMLLHCLFPLFAVRLKRRRIFSVRHFKIHEVIESMVHNLVLSIHSQNEHVNCSTFVPISTDSKLIYQIQFSHKSFLIRPKQRNTFVQCHSISISISVQDFCHVQNNYFSFPFFEKNVYFLIRWWIDFIFE